jgi:hypothetical protein
VWDYADAFGVRLDDHSSMQKSYGVVWREGEAPVTAGKLELMPQALRLEGREGLRDIPYDQVAGVRIGRSPADRLEGRPSIVLDCRGANPVTISTVAQATLVGEIAERLAALRLGAQPPGRLVIVLPLRPGAQEGVRRLLSSGPPFDPTAIDGLDRHEVFVTSEEAVFVFESSLGPETLAPLLARREIWQAAATWHELVAGPPRVADDAFSWSRPANGNGMSYLATPGPGDSEGGDIF